jgi:hypothetical protein
VNVDLIQKRFAEMKRVTESAYLEGRGIPRFILSSWRFTGRILED